jgi:putative ABC transport system permease protein
VVDLGVRILLHDRWRFLLTVTGVAFSVMLVLVQVGMFEGLLANASITIDRLDADLWVTSRNTPNVDFAHVFSEARVHRVRSVPGVQRADNLIVAYMEMALPSGTTEKTLVYALEDFGAWRFPWCLPVGDRTDLRRGAYVFMDDSSQRRFGPFEVGEYREVHGHRLEILGRTQGARSFTTTPLVFMDFRVAQSLLPDTLEGRTSYVVVKLAPGASRAAVLAELRRRLPWNDVYTREQWAARSRAYWIRNTGIGLNTWVTVALGCLVALATVAQTLHASTMEHTKEFAVVKAMGGTDADIEAILLEQAVIAALVGFGLALVPAFAIRAALARLDLQLVMTLPITAIVFAGTIVLCCAAALSSFRRVRHLDPESVFKT